MLKKVKRKDIYRYIFYTLLLVLFVVSISTPFLTSNDKDLYIYHLFNPTDTPFNGEIYNFYSYPIVIVTIMVIFFSSLPKLKNNLKKKINISILKIVLLFLQSHLLVQLQTIYL